jgi:hypothetical protein
MTAERTKRRRRQIALSAVLSSAAMAPTCSELETTVLLGGAYTDANAARQMIGRAIPGTNGSMVTGDSLYSVAPNVPVNLRNGTRIQSESVYAFLQSRLRSENGRGVEDDVRRCLPAGANVSIDYRNLRVEAIELRGAIEPEESDRFYSSSSRCCDAQGRATSACRDLRVISAIYEASISLVVSVSGRFQVQASSGCAFRSTEAAVAGGVSTRGFLSLSTVGWGMVQTESMEETCRHRLDAGPSRQGRRPDITRMIRGETREFALGGQLKTDNVIFENATVFVNPGTLFAVEAHSISVNGFVRFETLQPQAVAARGRPGERGALAGAMSTSGENPVLEIPPTIRPFPACTSAQNGGNGSPGSSGLMGPQIELISRLPVSGGLIQANLPPGAGQRGGAGGAPLIIRQRLPDGGIQQQTCAPGTDGRNGNPGVEPGVCEIREGTNPPRPCQRSTRSRIDAGVVDSSVQPTSSSP